MTYTRRRLIEVGGGLFAAPLVTRSSLAQVVGSGISGVEKLPGRTFFIAAAGNDSNPGTQALPWKTVAKVNAATMLPGDTYLFNGGDTFSGGPLFPQTTGTVGKPITFTSYGTGRATITAAANQTGFYVSNLSYIYIFNLFFVGATADRSVNTGIGIFIESAGANANQYSGITITNCDISLFGRGLYVGNDSGAGHNSGMVGLSINQCVVHNNGDGIVTYSNGTGVHSHTNLTVNQCVCYSNGAVGTITGNLGNGIVLGGVAGGTVTGCVAYSNGAVSTGGPVGIWSYDSTNVVISFCESYNNRSAGSDGGGFDLDGGCTNCIVEYCYSHGNYSYGFLLFAYSGAPATTGNVIRFCVSENDGPVGHGQGSIAVGSNGTTITGSVYGNTVYQNNSSVPCVAVLGSTAGVSFYNNIFYGANNFRFIETNTYAVGSLVFAGNDYFGTGNWHWNSTSYSTFSAWQTATNQEKVSGSNVGLTANPGLLSPGTGGTVNTGSYVTPALLATLTAYTITNASAMYHAGLNLTTDFSVNPGPQDFYSNAITASTLSVGADCPL